MLVIGVGFDGGESVQLCWGQGSCSNLGSSRTNRGGRFFAWIRVPQSAQNGSQSVTACTDGRCDSASVEVRGAEIVTTTTTAAPTTTSQAPTTTTTLAKAPTTTVKPTTTTRPTATTATAPEPVEESVGALEVENLEPSTTTVPPTTTTIPPTTTLSSTTSTTTAYVPPTISPDPPSQNQTLGLTLEADANPLPEAQAGTDLDIPPLSTEAGRQFLVLVWLALAVVFVMVTFWVQRHGMPFARRSRQ